MSGYLHKKELLKTFGEAGEYGEDCLGLISVAAPASALQRGQVAKFKTFDMPDLPKEYAGEYHWPVEAGVISSEYGRRFGRLHKGIDVARRHSASHPMPCRALLTSSSVTLET